MKRLIFVLSLALTTLLFSASVLAETGKGFSNFSEYNGELYGHWGTYKNSGSPAECHGVPIEANEICVYNNYIYYFSEYDTFRRCNLDRSNDILLSESLNAYDTYESIIYKNKLYYLRYDSSCNIHLSYMDLNTKFIYDISDYSGYLVPRLIGITDKYIYVSVGNNLCTLNLDGTGFNKIFTPSMLCESEMVYYTGIMDNMIYARQYNWGNEESNAVFQIDTTTNDETWCMNLGDYRPEFVYNGMVIAQNGKDVKIFDNDIRNFTLPISIPEDVNIITCLSFDTVYKGNIYYTIYNMELQTESGYKQSVNSGVNTYVQSWQFTGNGG